MVEFQQDGVSGEFQCGLQMLKNLMACFVDDREGVDSDAQTGMCSKPTRAMRILEIVLSLLIELQDIAQPGLDSPFSGPILHAEQGDSVNWRRMFMKIVKRAGLKPWPKMFQTLRATRETELAGKLPLHVVTVWCDNTPTIALKHFLMSTDDHFELASSLDVTLEPAGEKAARNPARYLSEWAETGDRRKKEPLEIPMNSEGFQLVRSTEYPREDLNLHGE